MTMLGRIEPTTSQLDSSPFYDQLGFALLGISYSHALRSLYYLWWPIVPASQPFPLFQ